MKEILKIIPNIEDWPINVFYSDRQRVVKKLARETVEELKKDPQLSSMLNQAVYAEKLRSKSNPLKVDPPKEYAYWKKIESELGGAIREDISASEVHKDLLQKIINRYSEEIVGDFNPKTFGFAKKVLTFLFKALFNPFKKKGQGFFWGGEQSLIDKFRIEGPMEQIGSLFDKGTVMVLPTHFSNLDSILIGYAIEKATNLPAFSYGAGLNLYDYELLAYFMSRLGAYKIDRRKRNPLYRKTLDQFATVAIQEGLNSIFFPGGTRSRSGALEDQLKWGLMNTIIDSQNEFFLRNVDRKIIIVPLVLSYHFVLEGQGLIDQHLQKTGKENYLNKLKRKNASMKKLRFIRRLFTNGSQVTLSFGHPIDIFGNKLDELGQSIKDGRIIDIKDYFKANGVLGKDKQRNRVYSRYLANEVVKSYKRENVVLTSHVAAFTTFQMFEKQYPNLDLFTLLSLPEDYLRITEEDLFIQIEKVQKNLRELAHSGAVKLSSEVDNFTPKELVSDAIKHLNSYHFYAPMAQKKGIITCEDLKLLYFYHNRLFGYKLDRIISSERPQALTVRKSLY